MCYNNAFQINDNTWKVIDSYKSIYYTSSGVIKLYQNYVLTTNMVYKIFHKRQKIIYKNLNQKYSINSFNFEMNRCKKCIQQK